MSDLFAPEPDPEFDEPAPIPSRDEQRKRSGLNAIRKIREQLRPEVEEPRG